MKKLFQTLIIIMTLALATSAWSAGTIKTFQLKLYNSTTSYTGVGDPNSGVTTAKNTNFNAGAAISAVSEFTHCGGPGNRNAIPNTTDSRTIDLNDHLGDFRSGFDIVFSPVVDEVDPSNSGVTLVRSNTTGGSGSDSASWMLGVKFSAIDATNAWANAPIFWAGPMDQVLASNDAINFDDRGGTTGWSLESGDTPMAYPVRGISQWIGGLVSSGGASTYVVNPLPTLRYMRPVFASASTPFRNVEYWMSLIPESD